MVRLKAAPSDVGHHAMTLRWINPRSAELWSSQAALKIDTPPPGTTELDMPVIIQLDLPIDVTGDYRMVIELEGRRHTEVVLHVRGGAPPVVPLAGGQMVS